MKRAIISVTDKQGIAELGQGLIAAGYELVASGGSAKALKDAGLSVTSVSDITKHPEILGGRVKTLHPAVHGGILSRRSDEHLSELDELGYAPFDVVVCNLYAFEESVRDPNISFLEAMEKVDIGGVTLLRAAAKNFESVSVLCDPSDYEKFLWTVDRNELSEGFRQSLALKAFAHTAAYDAAISTWLSSKSEGDMPAQIVMVAEKQEELRYGENPHQRAAHYRFRRAAPRFKQVKGEKALSYNNLVDLDAAWEIPQEFSEPAVSIIKHTNPCGAATGKTVIEAFEKALASDPVSAFGSILCVNREVDGDFIAAMGKLFVEVIAAPSFTDEALEILGKKKANTRVMEHQKESSSSLFDNSAIRMNHIDDGLLLMDADNAGVERSAWKVVTEHQPAEELMADLEFAWLVVKHVKSNAIVFAKDGATVGVGAGQMNRVGSVGLAADQAGEKAKGSVAGSDAFFPFADGVEAAAAAGVKAIVQPGGSKRDQEVIDACNRLGVAMIFTGERHFLH